MTGSSRGAMLRRVQIAGFAAHDAQLYLDAHPDDAAALAYFKKYRDLTREAAAAYEKRYGPLTAAASEGSPWPWVTDPWPWEPGANA